MELTTIANQLASTTKLINQFTITKNNKQRVVNDPIPVLKTALKTINKKATTIYMETLREQNISHIPHAYLPQRSIKTNAEIHKNAKHIMKFDFSKFYDHVAYDYIEPYLRQIDTDINDENTHLVKRLLIDPKTNGVTQGLPVSGALAGFALIPFWITLQEVCPDTVQFTQYSDDLIFSYTTKEPPPEFTIHHMTKIIKSAMKQSNRTFKLNEKKTCIQKNQYRNITGITVNQKNQLTPKLKDYRFLRMFSHNIQQNMTFEEALAKWNIPSKEAFIGKVSYMRSIDESGKIQRLLNKYANTYRKYGLFESWLLEINPFI